MTKKYFAIVSIALVLCLALGFGVIKKGSIDDPSKTAAPTVVTNNDNLITGAKYNPDNVNALWTQSFDGLALPSGWLNLQDAGTGLWSFTGTGSYPTCSPHSGAGMASFQSYSINVGSNASLVSQSFSLTGGAAKLGFWFYRDANTTYATYADLVNFKINTSPSPTGATLLGTINRSTTLAPVVSAEGWYYYEFSIPTSFNTATNYIIFSAVSAYGDNMYMDDVNVSLLLATDVGTQSVDVSTPITPGSVTPKATVKNFGSAPQTFPVTMVITPGGYTSTQTVTSLAAGTTTQVSFTNWAATNGTYTVKVYTQLTGDLDHTNDTLTKSILVSSATWASGSVIPGGSYLGSGVGYWKSGNDTTYLFALGGNAPNTTSLYKYNVMTDAWTNCAAIPNSKVVLGSAVVKDTVYSIAGSNGSAYSNELFKYNIKTNTWTTGTVLPTATLGWCKAAGYQDSLIYVVGGNDGTNAVATVYIYNAISGTWRTGTALPTACFGGGLAIAGNYLVYVGGIQGTAPGAATYKGLISQTDRSSITWTTGANYPGGTMWKFDAAPWSNNTVIMTTGTTGTSSTTWWTPASPNPCYTYDPATDTYTAKVSLATPVLGAYLGSVKIGTGTWKCIVASGYTGTAAITNTQIFTESPSGVITTNNQVPTTYALSQNYPNPFNPTTKISFALPKSGFVTLKIYDVMGREVSTLVNEYKTANNYSVEFNAATLSSGIYFYKINADGFTDIKKMMLVK